MSPSSSGPEPNVITPRDLTPQERSVLHRYRSWKKFHFGPRRDAEPLLRALPRYAKSVLVAGCQRSGTTILTRIIAGARGFQRFALTHDDELDAALILSACVRVPQDRRYCFQTTYLNERFQDYRLLRPDQRLVWVLRNPYSVVYSMLYNWRRFALNELYEGCAEPLEPASARRRLPWPFGPSQAVKACKAYAAKTAQVLEIRRLIRPEQLLVVEYDRMVREPQEWLPRIFAFAGEPYDPAYAGKLRADSLDKARAMSRRLTEQVESLAEPTYRRCLALLAEDSESARAQQRVASETEYATR